MGFLMDEDGIDSLIYEYFHDYENNPYKNLEYMVYVKESDFGGRCDSRQRTSRVDIRGHFRRRFV